MPAVRRSPVDGRGSLEVLAPVLEVQVSHGAFFGGGLMQRLVAHVVYQLRLMIPERNADVVRVTERQVRATTSPITSRPVERVG